MRFITSLGEQLRQLSLILREAENQRDLTVLADGKRSTAPKDVDSSFAFDALNSSAPAVLPPVSPSRRQQQSRLMSSTTPRRFGDTRFGLTELVCMRRICGHLQRAGSERESAAAAAWRHVAEPAQRHCRPHAQMPSELA